MSSISQNEVFSIPNKAGSLKQLVLILGKASNLRNFNKDSLGERTIGSLQVGSQILDALTSESDMFVATMRACEWNVTGTINQRNYSLRFNRTGTSFVVAFDLANDENSGWVSGPQIVQ